MDGTSGGLTLLKKTVRSELGMDLQKGEAGMGPGLQTQQKWSHFIWYAN